MVMEKEQIPLQATILIVDDDHNVLEPLLEH